MAERLNKKRIDSILQCLGEVTSGPKGDRLARLEATLMERGMTMDDALKIIIPNNEADTHECLTETGGELELNDVNPEDSISQVGYYNSSVKPKVRSDGRSVVATRSLIDARTTSGIKKLELNGRPRDSKSMVEVRDQLRNFVNDTSGSQAGSCISATSRTSRASQTSMKRREAAVQREIDAARTAKLEEAQELKRKQQLAKVDKEQRELDARQRELKERLEEIELEEEIKRLEKEADTEARRVAEEAWTRFEEIDMGFAQNLQVPLNKIGFRETGEVVEGTSGTKTRAHSEKPLKVERKNNNDGGSEQNKPSHGWKSSSATQVNNKKESPPLGDCILRELIASNLWAAMPKHDIKKFRGDIASYLPFKQAFRGIMESGVVPSGEKLHYLYQFTEDEPKELVQACMYMDEEEGYKEVWQIFDKKYGAPELIGTEFIDRLLSKETIRNDDVNALNSYAVALRLTRNVVDKIPSGKSQLEHPTTIRALLRKLPNKMVERWRYMKIDKGELSYGDLVHFVEREAKAASDPLYGKEVMQNISQSDGMMMEKNKINANAVIVERVPNEDQTNRQNYELSNPKTSNTNSVRCMNCGRIHDILSCTSFKEMTVRDRIECVKANRGCFICLREGHMASQCMTPKSCEICQKWHHPLLHVNGGWMMNKSRNEGKGRYGITLGYAIEKRNGYASTNRNLPSMDPQLNIRNVSQEDESNNADGHGDDRVRVGMVSTNHGPVSSGTMPVLSVTVRKGSECGVEVSAFLDSGSAGSFCTRRLLDKLGILEEELHETNLYTETINAFKKEKTFLVTGLIIKGKRERESIPLPPLYVIPKIPIDYDDVMTKEEMLRWEHLADLNLDKLGDVDLMIGGNVPAALGPIDIRAPPHPGDPYAVKTRLGWTLGGLIELTGRIGMKVNRVRCNISQIKSLVEKAFESGFEDDHDDKKALSVDDERWVDIVEKGCRKYDGHYEIPLPLRSDLFELPRSRANALRRTSGLQKKLRGDPDIREKYEKCVGDMIEKGYAEKVLENEQEGKWYIPHFAVTHPNKPGKVRMVFDCAARVGGIALNDLLYQGPDLTTHLLDVLLRFRLGHLGFMADIESMFYQIRVPRADQDYLRFFWWEGGVMSGRLREYRMTVHLFGACSSPSIANYALKRVADDKSEGSSNSVADILRENFYVDDCLKAATSRDQICVEARTLKSLCSEGGFNLCKFVSNVEDIEREMRVESRDMNDCRALGISWNRNTNELGVIPFEPRKVLNKRTLLSVIAGIYDPLGIVAPLVLQGRILFQRAIMQSGANGWDNQFTVEEITEIETWIERLGDIYKMKINRSIVGSGEKVKELHLHVFGDACERGHAAVAYVLLKMQSGENRCIFVWGKAKVNPLKTVSIPRLELVASTLVARMSRRLRDTLSVLFKKVHLWTDSMTVLRYLRNEKLRFHTFVANRVANIKRRTDVSEWRYVSSELNPADDGSRGKDTHRWRSGPEFLLSDESSWPIEQDAVNIESEAELEIRKSVKTMRVSERSNSCSKIWEFYSDWKKLLKGVAWLIKFKQFIISKGEKQRCTLHAVDIEEAEREVVRNVKEECYREEYRRLSRGETVRKGSSLAKLCVYMKDKIIRVGGRLENAEMTYESKFPVVLPHKHHITTLIIREYHERAGHLGTPTVLGLIRERYWITRGFSTVRSELGKCVTCRRVQGRVLDQKMAPLPFVRVAEQEPAFTYTGMDCFGPFFVTLGRGRQKAKRYGALFTCMTIRAVHLEIAVDLTTDAIIRAIRRFVARRGQVKLLRSDNGTNFVGARRVMLKALGNPEVVNDLEAPGGVRWEFNPPSASHFWGVWERIIRTVRRVMESTMTGKTFTDDGLYTLLCEAEAAINSRPIAILGNDPSSPALTPQRLLNLGNSITNVINLEDRKIDNVSRWEHIQTVANQFWKRWCREYRSSLQGRQRWTSEKRNVKVGDIVMIVSELEARCHWPIGRVTSVEQGSDGNVRCVSLYARGKEYKRPVSKLVLLIEGKELP